jgi:hypothetical protein
MQPGVRLVHRTRDRMRLRISEKRKDIRYFVDMYEILRKIPGVTDVVINPVTGSVLLYFPEELGAPVLRSLQHKLRSAKETWGLMPNGAILRQGTRQRNSGTHGSHGHYCRTGHPSSPPRHPARPRSHDTLVSSRFCRFPHESRALMRAATRTPSSPSEA